MSQHLIQQGHDCNSKQFPTKYRVSSTSDGLIRNPDDSGPKKRGHATFLTDSSARGLERRAFKCFHIALGVVDREASADDYSQRLGCRLDLLIPGKYAFRFGKWATKKVGLAGGMGRAMWSGVAMLSSSDYLDGVLGRLNLLFLCASESICFRALS